MRILFFAFLLFSTSCSLLRGVGLQKKTYTYTSAGGVTSIDLMVPKRFSKEERTVDSAGNQQLFYRYPDGSVFYVLQVKDTVTLFQPVNKENNIAKPHLQGGVFYKGMDSTERWWREAKLDRFRIGYLNVPNSTEMRFDSAVNFVRIR